MSGSSSTRLRAFDHEHEDADSLPPPPDFGTGTPWPLTAVPTEISDLGSAEQARPTPAEPYAFLDEDSLDADLTEPVPLQQLEQEAAQLEMDIEPLRVIELEADDVGTRTLMGVGARAVRAVATAGWMEARAARRGLSPTPGLRSPPLTTQSDEAPGPPRVIVSSQLWDDGSSHGKVEAAGPSVQPPHPQDQLSYPVVPRSALGSIAPSMVPPSEPEAEAEAGVEPWWPEVQAREVAPVSSRIRVLAFAGLALGLLGIGMYIGMAGF